MRRATPTCVLLTLIASLAHGHATAAAEIPATRLRIRVVERGVYALSPADLAGTAVVLRQLAPGTATRRLDTV
jgi:hypothetical protein